MGLHRAQTYRHLSKEEQEKRLAVWWCCYMLDHEISLKNGKPPMINDIDVTAPPLLQVPEFCNFSRSDNYPHAALNRRTKHQKISEYLNGFSHDMENLGHICFVTQVDFSMIISKAHKTLFSATACRDHSELEIIKITGDIIQDLDYWRLCFPESMRPRKFDNELDDCTGEELVEVAKRYIGRVVEVQSFEL
ncbi:unnamed protein product [Ambrosiozyma monospora]|uniref:Unnamed protein product n=1 Tax=Ambrosiozyma monospora TaxID=43982 RepID=A0ACB5TWB9_AMBMO|nr:unnamed protein product [Ambrosiozyma monospora]